MSAAPRRRRTNSRARDDASRIPARNGPNQTEAKYAEILELRRIDGEIRSYHYEAETLPLSRSMPPRYRCQYTPDYVVILADGAKEYHEVKGGHMREDGWLKVKWAVDAYPAHTFVLARRRRDGSWAIERFRGRPA
jgi:hypothetical protein